MPESSQHQQLIERTITYIRERFSDEYSLTIFHDLPKELGEPRPPRIGQFTPDVYAVTVPPTITIIGEAKTPDDLEAEHSRMQYLEYLQYLDTRPNGLLVLAVTFYKIPAAHRMMSSILRRSEVANTCQIVFIDETRAIVHK